MSAKHIFHSLQKPVEVTFTSPKLLPTSDGKKGVCVAKRPGGAVEVGQLAWLSEPGWATVSSPVERYVVEQVPTAIPEKDVRGGTSTAQCKTCGTGCSGKSTHTHTQNPHLCFLKFNHATPIKLPLA